MTIRLIGLYSGEPTPDDGQYVMDYDPEPRRNPDGSYWVYLVTTGDPTQAKQFASAREAVEYYRRSYGIRPDGKPNRPLTAYTAEFS